MTDFEVTAEFLKEMGYPAARQLPNGNWLAVYTQMFTTGVMLIEKGDSFGYRCRFCYERTADALVALATWDGQGDDPPGPWVKQKGRNSEGRIVDRLNPALADEHAEF